MAIHVSPRIKLVWIIIHYQEVTTSLDRWSSTLEYRELRSNLCTGCALYVSWKTGLEGGHLGSRFKKVLYIKFVRLRCGVSDMPFWASCIPLSTLHAMSVEQQPWILQNSFQHFRWPVRIFLLAPRRAPHENPNLWSFSLEIMAKACQRLFLRVSGSTLLRTSPRCPTLSRSSYIQAKTGAPWTDSDLGYISGMCVAYQSFRISYIDMYSTTRITSGTVSNYSESSRFYILTLQTSRWNPNDV